LFRKIEASPFFFLASNPLPYYNIAMKIQTVLLIIVVLVLAFIALELGQIQELLSVNSQGDHSQSLVASNQAIIQSNQRLETAFGSLRQEIADFREKIIKK